MPAPSASLFPNLNQHVGPTRPLSLAGTTRLSRDGRSHPRPRSPAPSSGVLSPAPPPPWPFPCAAARGDTLLDAAVVSWKVHGMDAMAAAAASASGLGFLFGARRACASGEREAGKGTQLSCSTEEVDKLTTPLLNLNSTVWPALHSLFYMDA